jgi:hypothetical protein
MELCVTTLSSPSDPGDGSRTMAEVAIEATDVWFAEIGATKPRVGSRASWAKAMGRIADAGFSHPLDRAAIAKRGF